MLFLSPFLPLDVFVYASRGKERRFRILMRQPHSKNNYLFGFFLSVLALLVCDTAARLASGLAGSLALAAAAFLRALAKVACFDRLDMFH